MGERISGLAGKAAAREGAPAAAAAAQHVLKPDHLARPAAKAAARRGLVGWVKDLLAWFKGLFAPKPPSPLDGELKRIEARVRAELAPDLAAGRISERGLAERMMGEQVAFMARSRDLVEATLRKPG